VCSFTYGEKQARSSLIISSEKLMMCSTLLPSLNKAVALIADPFSEQSAHY
jgi:hypothetical protein